MNGSYGCIAILLALALTCCGCKVAQLADCEVLGKSYFPGGTGTGTTVAPVIGGKGGMGVGVTTVHIPETWSLICDCDREGERVVRAFEVRPEVYARCGEGDTYTSNSGCKED